MDERPNYLRLIEDHWRWCREDYLDATAGYLYLYLLHYCNTLNWKQVFTLTNRKICADLDITDKTLIAARGRLVDAGRIAFHSGRTKREPSKYEIMGCKNSTPFGSENGSQSGSENGSQSGKRGGKTPHNINETKQKKTDIVCVDNSQAAIPALFDEPERAQRHKKEFEPPRLDEVISYADQNYCSQDEARKFFDYYNAQGWVRSNGRKIQNWQSAFNGWMRNTMKFATEEEKSEVRKADFQRKIMDRLRDGFDSE